MNSPGDEDWEKAYEPGWHESGEAKPERQKSQVVDISKWTASTNPMLLCFVWKQGFFKLRIGVPFGRFDDTQIHRRTSDRVFAGRIFRASFLQPGSSFWGLQVVDAFVANRSLVFFSKRNHFKTCLDTVPRYNETNKKLFLVDKKVNSWASFSLHLNWLAMAWVFFWFSRKIRDSLSLHERQQKILGRGWGEPLWNSHLKWNSRHELGFHGDG